MLVTAEPGSALDDLSFTTQSPRVTRPERMGIIIVKTNIREAK